MSDCNDKNHIWKKGVWQCTCKEPETLGSTRNGSEKVVAKICSKCGCTDQHACPGGCSWAKDGMCTTCFHAEKCHADPCTCDGYHTFDELYNHRATLFIVLCKELSKKITVDNVVGAKMHPVSKTIWRSKYHYDVTMYKDMFIMGIGTEDGKQITYHLDLDRWDECDFAKTIAKAPKFDGHTPDDILTRLKKL